MNATTFPAVGAEFTVHSNVHGPSAAIMGALLTHMYEPSPSAGKCCSPALSAFGRSEFATIQFITPPMAPRVAHSP